MSSDNASGQVCAHVTELSDGNKIEDVKLAGHCAVRRTRQDIHDLCDEVIKPKHIKKAEDRICHRAKRCIVPETFEHLSGKNGEEKEQEYRHLEVVGMPKPGG